MDDLFPNQKEAQAKLDELFGIKPKKPQKQYKEDIFACFNSVVPQQTLKKVVQEPEEHPMITLAKQPNKRYEAIAQDIKYKITHFSDAQSMIAYEKQMLLQREFQKRKKRMKPQKSTQKSIPRKQSRQTSVTNTRVYLPTVVQANGIPFEQETQSKNEEKRNETHFSKNKKKSQEKHFKTKVVKQSNKRKENKDQRHISKQKQIIKTQKQHEFKKIQRQRSERQLHDNDGETKEEEKNQKYLAVSHSRSISAVSEKAPQQPQLKQNNQKIGLLEQIASIQLRDISSVEKEKLIMQLIDKNRQETQKNQLKTYKQHFKVNNQEKSRRENRFQRYRQRKHRKKHKKSKRRRRDSSSSSSSSSYSSSSSSSSESRSRHKRNFNWRKQLRQVTGYNPSDLKYKRRDRMTITDSDLKQIQMEEGISRYEGLKEEEAYLRWQKQRGRAKR